MKYQGFGGGSLGPPRDGSGNPPSGWILEVAYVFVMFKGNVTFAAAGTDKDNKPGEGEEGRAKVLVKMRKRYFVSRFIVSPTERKTFANKGNPTQYTLFHRAGPGAFSGGHSDQSHVSFQTLPALWELAAFCGYQNVGTF